jgi:hypothetical protein
MVTNCADTIYRLTTETRVSLGGVVFDVCLLVSKALKAEAVYSFDTLVFTYISRRPSSAHLSITGFVGFVYHLMFLKELTGPVMEIRFFFLSVLHTFSPEDINGSVSGTLCSLRIRQNGQSLEISWNSIRQKPLESSKYKVSQ